jgi:hypothetical protein
MPQVLGRILQKRYAQNRQDDGRIEAKYAWQRLPSAVSCGDVPAEQNDLVTTRFSYPITVIQTGFLTSPEAGRESADVSEQAVHGAEAGAPSPSSENLASIHAIAVGVALLNSDWTNKRGFAGENWQWTSSATFNRPGFHDLTLR